MSRAISRLQKRARQAFASVERARRDPRYDRVLGRLCSAGYLTTNFPVPPERGPLAVEDALWVGRLEPRVLELLPALIVKRPSLFESVQNLPQDLDFAVRALRRNETPETFRGIPGEDLHRWLPRVGRQGKVPTRMKPFRLHADDVLLLRELSEKLGVTETEVVRRSLHQLAAQELLRKRR